MACSSKNQVDTLAENSLIDIRISLILKGAGILISYTYIQPPQIIFPLCL